MTKTWLHFALTIAADISAELAKADAALAPIATKIGEALAALEAII